MSLPAILLVDDDPDYLEIARRALRLERLDVEVLAARDGTDALRILGLAGPANGVTPPNLVVAFVDLDMPGLDGWDVLRRVRADDRLRRLPVVIVSSSPRSEDVRRSYDLGANSYVVKRYDPAGPGRYLARAARYWLELNCVGSGPIRRTA